MDDYDPCEDLQDTLEDMCGISGAEE